jgi:hypothetical protein
MMRFPLKADAPPPFTQVMQGKWTESARSFMRQVIRGGGVRYVGQKSKFASLALCLHQDHGMLTLESYEASKSGKQGMARYRVTERGLQEFGGES